MIRARPVPSDRDAAGRAPGGLIAAFPAQPSHRLGTLRRRAGSGARLDLTEPPSHRRPNPSPNDARRPNKCKQNQGKLLAFPWISLAKSGLFNGLQRIQIKKSVPVSRCVRSVTAACSCLLATERPRSAAIQKRIALISQFHEKMHDFRFHEADQHSAQTQAQARQRRRGSAWTHQTSNTGELRGLFTRKPSAQSPISPMAAGTKSGRSAIGLCHRAAA